MRTTEQRGVIVGTVQLATLLNTANQTSNGIFGDTTERISIESTAVVRVPYEELNATFIDAMEPRAGGCSLCK